jgi:hypothetical protein
MTQHHERKEVIRMKRCRRDLLILSSVGFLERSDEDGRLHLNGASIRTSRTEAVFEQISLGKRLDSLLAEITVSAQLGEDPWTVKRLKEYLALSLALEQLEKRCSKPTDE